MMLFCDDCGQAYESIYGHRKKGYCVWCLRKRLSGRTIVESYAVNEVLAKELLDSDITGEYFIPDKVTRTR